MTQAQAELQTIPDTYSTDWIEKLDGRTRIAQAVNARLQALVADLGGDLSYQRMALVKRCLWMEVLLEQQEAAVARGAEIDQGRYTQTVNGLVGVLRTLGLERHARRVPNISDYLKQKEAVGGTSMSG